MQAAITFPEFLRPEIITVTLFGFEFALRWYALAYIVGILIGWRISLAAVRRPLLWPGDRAPLTTEQVEDLLTWIIIGVIVGGRLGFVIFYRPLHYLENPLEILMVWRGGMAFHGGFLGVVLAVWGVSRKYGAPLPQVADMLAISVPPALFLGRLSNFVNGELWGRPWDGPWAVIFPDPTSQQMCGDIAVGMCARHPSQLYQAALEGLLLAIVLLWLAFRRGALRMPWLSTGVFLGGYGMARFVVEFFRQPDIQFIGPDNPVGYSIQFGGYGLTQGQVLSLPMILVGLALLLAARHRAPA